MSGPRKFKARVKDTTTTTGTGDITLSGTAPTGFENFNTAVGTSVRFNYAIELDAEWEEGEGYLSASTTLVRETVYESSNSDALVNFSAGTKNVFLTIASFFAQRVTTHGRAYAHARGMCMQ